MDPASGAAKTWRSDARRNRAEIIAAASDLFARRGVDVPVSDIAEAAGVAVGTLYRHVGSKEALVDALLLARIRSAAEETASAVAEHDDPWERLSAFLRAVTTAQLADRALAQHIGGRVVGSAELREERKKLFDGFQELVDAASEAGTLRPDVRATDIRVAMICLARAGAADWPGSTWVVDRLLPLVLDGLRAPGHTRLAGPAPPIEELQVAPPATSPFQRGRRSWRP